MEGRKNHWQHRLSLLSIIRSADTGRGLGRGGTRNRLSPGVADGGAEQPRERDFVADQLTDAALGYPDRSL